MTRLRVLTWNLQGSEGVDIEAVAATIADAGADAVALQEVQRRQAGRLADALGYRHRWVFKHWPLRTWAEGLAVLTPHDITHSHSFVLLRRPRWDWRRRVGMLATIERSGSAEPASFVIGNVHLSPHGEVDQRRREAEQLVAEATEYPGGSDALIAGDFNGAPDEDTLVDLDRAGWRDSWGQRWPDVDGWTNWSPGDRRGRDADQRIDYVLAPDRWQATDAEIAPGEYEFDFADVSDHLPLIVTFGPADLAGGDGRP